MEKRVLVGSTALALACSSPAAADAVTQWEQFFDDGGPAFLEDSDWTPLTSNYPMQIGMIARAHFYVAWREGNEIGVFLHYRYDPAVSSAELPGPGPMSDEYVEVTVNCAAATTRVHYMYLYAPDGRSIGTWYDPSAVSNPQSYQPSSIIGMAASRVC